MIKMSFTSSFNFFILTSQFILQLYHMFMLIADTAESLIFNNKIMTDFFEQLNDLYKKHDIIEND